MRATSTRRSTSSALSAALVLLAALGVASSSLAPPRARADDALERRIAAALEPRAIDLEPTRAWPAAPLLDRARAAVGAELAWRREGGGRGRGATICVVDTGIDLGHRDFRDAEGRTRVRFALDLFAPARGVHPELERGGGAVWSSAEIDLALARGEPPIADRSGHGTEVASAAAGDDSPSPTGDDGREAGIAPEADLVVVRALDEARGGFVDADVVRGARFCVDPRVSEPERTVVLLALGGHDGPHDGTSAYERAVSAIAASGAAVVVAAGNDAGRSLHARGWLVGDEPSPLTVRIGPTSRDDALLVVVVRGAREVRAALEGRARGPFVPRGARSDDGRVLVDARDPVTTWVIARGTLRGELAIEARGALAPGARLDAWIAEADVGASGFAPRFVGPSAREGSELRIPATAPGVVSVGASVSRGFLAPERGERGVTLEADPLERALFSSRGPGVRGEPLPTLLAPGGVLVVARSSALVVGAPGAPPTVAELERLSRGADRIAATGTSLSAAIVAGAIAIARGASPSRGASEASLLAASARSIEGPYAPEAGAGALDLPAYLALRERRPGELAEALELGCTARAITPRASDVAIVVRSRGGGTTRLFARAADADFTSAGWLLEGYGAARVRVPPVVIGARVPFDVLVDGHAARACELVVVDPTTADRLAFAPACSASSGASRARAPLAGWLLLLLALGAARASRRLARAVVVGSPPCRSRRSSRSPSPWARSPRSRDAPRSS